MTVGPPPGPQSRAFLAYGKLRMVYDLVPVGILLCDTEGTIHHSNKRAQRLLRAEPMDIRGRSIFDLSVSDDRSRAPNLSKVGRSPSSTGLVINHKIRRFDGTTLFSRTGFTGIDDESGRIQYLIVTLEDVTEDVESRQKLSRRVDTLQLANQEVRDLLESLGEGVLMVSLSGEFRLVNQIARDLFGKCQTFKGLPTSWPEGFGIFDQNQMPLTGAGLPLSRSLSQQEVVTNEILYMRAPGKPEGVWVIASSRPTFQGQTQTGAVLVFRDITALVEQQEELKKSNADLERFAAVASHDMQEPPRQIAAYADRALSKYRDEMPSKAVQYLEIIHGSASRMQVLISDLLAYSRVGRKEDPFQEVDLEKTIRVILTDFRTRVEETGATFDIGPLPKVGGDPTQLRLLFQNLISNGLKFQPKGNRPRIEIRADVAENTATITVLDNGIGFNSEYRDKIFEIFRRLVGKSEYPGTGIGLALCQRIIDRHGGEIFAHSTPGVGSQFTVKLPVRHTREAGS